MRYRTIMYYYSLFSDCMDQRLGLTNHRYPQIPWLIFTFIIVVAEGPRVGRSQKCHLF